jgi:CRP-like cAMP-binding protein
VTITAGLGSEKDVVSAEYAQLLLPKFTDEQLATLTSYGTKEQTSVGQILAAAGDLSYDLMVVLEGEVECSYMHEGHRRALLTHGPRDFIAELDLLTGQRVYATFVVTRAGCILRVPRSAMKTIIEEDSALGELMVQTLFRRRQALLLIVRGDGLAQTMSTYLLDRSEHDTQITVYPRSAVAAVHGDRQLDSVVIEDRRTGEHTDVRTHYLFAMIGAEPHTSWLDGAVQRDRSGFIPTGDDIPAGILSDNDWSAVGRGPYLLDGSLPGVFAVGDVRANSVKRVAAAVGEGSMAVRLVQQYLGQTS